MIFLKFIICLVVGLIALVILLVFGFETASLTTMLTTTATVIVVYVVLRYKLTAPISLSIQRKLAVGFLLPVLFVNSSILFMEIQGRQNITVSITLVILTILAIVFSPVVSRTITKPISRLREAVDATCEGDLNVKIDVKSKDEIGELASSFERLTRDMKKSRIDLNGDSKELQKRAEQMTRELKKSKKELDSKINELEEFNKLAVSRELKMAELKKRIKELENK